MIKHFIESPYAHVYIFWMFCTDMVTVFNVIALVDSDNKGLFIYQ